MCFSAEASFTVGTGIGIMGIATIRKLITKSLIWIALVPVFFAFQQYNEGVVWLHMNGEFQATTLSETSKMIYLFFAYCFWSTYIPLAFFIAEKVKWRKIACGIVLAGGLVGTLFNINYLMSCEIVPEVAGRSLYYGVGRLDMRIYYGLAIIVPMFISSVRNIWIMGVLIASSFVFSQITYNLTFTSVWCFLAAAISFLLYFLLDEQKPMK